MPPIAHPGRLLRRELEVRGLSASRLAQGLGVPSGRITDILNGRRSITAEVALRLGRHFGNNPQFWLDLQSQYDLAAVEAERGAEIARRVQPADAAWTVKRGDTIDLTLDDCWQLAGGPIPGAAAPTAAGESFA